MKIAELSIEKEMKGVGSATSDPIFHRIDIEYIAVLKSYDKEKITQALSSGLQASLNQTTGDYVWENQLYSQVEEISLRLAVQSSRLFGNFNTSSKSEQSCSHPNEELVGKLILTVLATTDETHRTAIVEHSIERLTQALSINQENYRLHFDLAWLYLFYQKNYIQAKNHFEIAAYQASSKNLLFAIFASRHLAKAYYLSGEYKRAEATMTEVLNSALHPDPEYQYEYARYLAAMGELKLSSLYLEQTIEKLPIYYTQATVEPDFKSKGIISQLLVTYKEQSLKYIREQYTQTWQESALVELELPEDLSTQQVFQKSCQKHEEAIKKHPFIVVKNNKEQVKQQLLKHSKEALLTELIDKETHYMKAIGDKRKGWKLINKSGGILIHAASILLLGTFFVLAAKFILVSLGLGTVFHFEEVTGRAFIVVLILGFTGTYLLKSQPFGIKKLFRKSLLFREAMTMVHKM